MSSNVPTFRSDFQAFTVLSLGTTSTRPGPSRLDRRIQPWIRWCGVVRVDGELDGVFVRVRRRQELPDATGRRYVLHTTPFVPALYCKTDRQETACLTHPSFTSWLNSVGGAPIVPFRAVQSSGRRKLWRLGKGFVAGTAQANRVQHEIERESWPESVRKLEFGPCFRHPVTNFIWPTSPQELVFGFYFNKPVKGIEWPDSLRRLTFGSHFSMPLDGVKWPDSLQQLTFGDRFNRSIRGVFGQIRRSV